MQHAPRSSSSGVPAGMSTTTWNSRLVVERQHLQHDAACTTASDTDSDDRDDDADASSQRRLRRPRAASRNGVSSAREQRASRRRAGRRWPVAARALPAQLQRQPRRDDERDRQRDQHAHAGVDRDRAHVRPHQAGDERHRQQRGDHREGGEDGRAADLVDRARDERRAAARPGASARWRWMFSTTTIASSTRMPIEKISANSDTRFSVKPQAQDANSVAASVSITATPTITASRRPSATQHQRDHRQRREDQLLDQLAAPCRSRSRRSCA